MGKFTRLQEDAFSIFNSAEWKAENIKTFPNNFITVNPGNEFIRVSIIGSGIGINLESVSGVFIIDIFTSAGNGPRQASLIADKLDQYLVGKSISGESGSVTQFSNSALDARGLDRDNPALFRSLYTIPFNYFGKIK
jgi:hypothetical protein